MNGRPAETARYFDDFKVGERVESPGITLTESRIVEFAFLYDPQPIHIDVEAARARHYGDVIASGTLTFALATRLFIQSGIFDACYIGGIGVDELRWHRPVRPGDTIRLVAEVVEMRPSASRADRGTLRTAHTVLNQRDETVMTMSVTHVLRRRPGP